MFDMLQNKNKQKTFIELEREYNLNILTCCFVGIMQVVVIAPQDWTQLRSFRVAVDIISFFWTVAVTN